MTVVLGIDVGGTKIAAGLVDVSAGRVLSLRRRATPVEDGGGAVLDACVALAREIAPAGTPTGIGLCELVDRAGRPASAATIDWRGLDVPGAFASIGRVALESDVRAAAAAEARFGAGRGFASFVFLTVGTGISHCLVLERCPYPGAHGAALVTGAPPVEERASGTALARRSGHRRAEEVLADPACAPLVASAAHDLGLALAALVNALDPEAVVVGGGLGLVDRYRDLAVASARRAIFADAARGLPVLPAACGVEGAVLGAALAAPLA